uniref:Uncharacterized protein n=1 Tax=viral metagenome TaxID=1070528 RepID=A0A6H1ZTW8_9ZZZZ
MATASSVITSSRYDLRDTGSIEYSDAELLEYLNRAIISLDAALASLNSDWVEDETTWTLTTNASTLTQTTNVRTIRTLWIGDDRIWKTALDEIRRKRKFITAAGQPDYYAQNGTTIVFERKADQSYTVTAHINKATGTLTTSSNMPYNDEFNEPLRQAVVLIAKARNELSVVADAALFEFFMSAATVNVIKRKYIPKKYYLGF